jgi:hypothetical protein
MEDNIKKNIPDKLESTERDLYNRKKEPKATSRHELSRHESMIPSSWSEEEPMKNKKRKKHLMYSKKFRNVFLVAIVFFLGSIVFAFLTFFQGGTTVSNNNIDIVVLGNSFVDGGEELPLQIKVANRNRTSIEIADMLVEYSKGVGGAGDTVRERISLGEIKAGDVAEDIVEVTLFGEQGSVRDITFTLEYRVTNSNAVFVKEYAYQVTIATSPVDVIVTAPSTVVSNQEFTTEVSVLQNSTEITENMMVIANYPSGFKFDSAVPEPDFGNDTWFLGDLAPGVEKVIKIQGSIKASNGEERIITIVTGSQDGEDEQEIGIQFTATPHAIVVGAPFVSAEMKSGSQSATEFTVSPSDETVFSIVWQNELETSLSDLEIVADFSGNGFDPTRVSVNQGFFDVNNSSIVWNQTNNTSLKSIPPGETGQLSFSLRPKSGVTNPTIYVSIRAQGVLVGQGTGVEEVDNIYNGTIRVASDVLLSSSLLHNSGPFNNTGAIPPSVGDETTYAIEWALSSSTSGLKDATVTAELPSYVTWKNETFPGTEDISYNAVTREVTWSPGTIDEGGNGQKKAYFKIGFTPTATHIGINPPVVSTAYLSAKDAFTDASISKTMGQLTSSLWQDSGYDANNDKVVE